MFAEKVVIITGASSGLGRQLAHDLAARRCRVVLFARNADVLAEAVAECEAAGGEAMAVTGDVTQPEDCERLIAKTTERFGSIDFLISNAGLSGDALRRAHAALCAARAQEDWRPHRFHR
jgi:NAD(P)-dependent dehydrogenase (short-subunit alcohol dehydrogenase family)